jgi:hypothetical protein
MLRVCELGCTKSDWRPVADFAFGGVGLSSPSTRYFVIYGHHIDCRRHLVLNKGLVSSQNVDNL